MDREERIQEREAKKVAAEAEVEAKKIEAEAEAKRLETEAETKRLETEAETKRLEVEAETKSWAKAKKKLEDSPVPLKNVVTPDLSVNEEDLDSLLREDETLKEVLSVSREDEKYAVCAEKVVDVEEPETVFRNG
ncbi:ribonuclease Y-like [Littorina saxatilis]|uniref:ribonuclease Y-like n=1 Tax=Littorina saxatilis TaxID=31220 RepID=UPI0038B66E55